MKQASEKNYNSIKFKTSVEKLMKYIKKYREFNIDIKNVANLHFDRIVKIVSGT